MRRWVILALALPLACGKSLGGEAIAPHIDAPSPATTEGSRVPYGQAVMKTTHNAYERDEPLFDQLVYHRIRSLELDVHVSRARARSRPGEWFVYHADLPLFRDTSCVTLSDCLGQITAFHAAVPQHEVVTLFVDLKDDLSEGHTARDLDGALESELGRDALVEPRDVIARCEGAGSLREAVTGRCAFPSLGDLRGKIIVAVTGGALCGGASYVSQYAGAEASGRAAFLAPALDDACPIERYRHRQDVVFFNMSYGERRRAAAVRERGLVARLYRGGLVGGLDTAAEFFAARAAGAQLLATDHVNADVYTWATTSSPRGWPFKCVGCDANVEMGDLLGMRATSGDLGRDEDSAYFAYVRDDGESTWSTFVSVPSSNVEPLAKGCLMARASEAPDAATAALCRPLDRDPPRLLVRRARGALATWIEMRDVAGVSSETPAFLRLSAAPSGRGTEVHGEASADGRTWRTVGRALLSTSLPLRGIAMASSGPAAAKALFGNLRRTTNGATVALRAGALTGKALGGAARGDLFDGVTP